MELAFVFTALRRRVWVIVLFTALGLLAGLFVAPSLSDSSQWQSEALINIQPPSSQDAVFSETINPDRYVASQIAVLRSEATALSVSEKINGLEVGNVLTQVEIEERPDTDIVVVTGTAPDQLTTQELVRTYVNTYQELLPQDDEERIQKLKTDEAALQTRLNEVNDQLSEAITRGRSSQGQRPLPDQADPGLASQRQLIQDQLSRNQQRQDELESSKARINTRIIQEASTPVRVSSRTGIVLPAAVAAGLILGTVFALLMARFSNKVQDDRAAELILGVPVVGEFDHYRSLAREHLAAFQRLPDDAVPLVEQLCVRAEAKAQLNVPLTVAVVGTQRGAGATTLALAMAERFAGLGSSVVLVDADVRDPRVTELFHAGVDGGIPSVLANDGALVDQRGRSVFTRTMDPEVRVLGLGPNRAVASLRRDTVSSVLRAACHQGAVVVVDGGPVFDLASTVQLTQLVDAVVVAVPLQRQKADELADLSRQLGPVEDKLLPVLTYPALRAAKEKSVRFEDEVSQEPFAGQPQ